MDEVLGDVDERDEKGIHESLKITDPGKDSRKDTVLILLPYKERPSDNVCKTFISTNPVSPDTESHFHDKIKINDLRDS